MSQEDRLKFWINLLEMEVEALRSVISEWERSPNEFIQWNKAQAIDALKKYLVYP